MALSTKFILVNHFMPFWENHTSFLFHQGKSGGYKTDKLGFVDLFTQT